MLAQGEGVGEVPDGPGVFRATAGKKGGSRTRFELRDAHVPHGPDLGPFAGNAGEMLESCLERVFESGEERRWIGYND